VRLILALLCLAGIYDAAYMFAKQRRIERGELQEDSVVSTPRAKVAGVSNGLIGLVYYCALLIAHPLLGNPIVYDAALTAAVLAGAFSVYLGYSLLFVTRRRCAYCWAGHVINWSLLALLLIGRHGLTASQ